MNEDRIIDGVFILLVCLIIYLKIIGIITIPWLWLFAPIWIPFLLGCGLAICLLVIFLITGALKKNER